MLECHTYALWTAKMVGELIHQRFGIQLSKASVCRLLGQPGLTPQRPFWRAYQQKPDAVQKWLQEAYPQIKQLAQKIHGSARTIFLIVDGHPVHKAKSVARFIETVKDRFQIFFLPPYSPELNPDERVWNDLKNNAVGRQSVKSPQ